MSLFITSLNSGSNGNCYYIGNNTESVLIDAGISCRETEKRMLALGLDISSVKALFISHEHSDHIKGLPGIVEKYKIPVYISQVTAKNLGIPFNISALSHFESYQTINIGNLSITAFPKYHDAVDPHSFIISQNNITVGVFTDIGRSCNRVLKYFQQCNAAFLESNYDSEMLANGKYPHFLKARIKGGNGHLSNDQALEIFKKRSSGLTHLLLSHLSQHNNCPLKAAKLFKDNTTTTEIIVAPRNTATSVYTITSSLTPLVNRRKLSIAKPLQLSIF